MLDYFPCKNQIYIQYRKFLSKIKFKIKDIPQDSKTAKKCFHNMSPEILGNVIYLYGYYFLKIQQK